MYEDLQWILEVIDSYPAKILFELGIKPPKWKERYKTRQEAITACREVIEKKYGITKIKQVTDYSTWK